MPIRSPLRALPLPALLILAALAPASAEAAFVTAVDVSVRPAESSPWSKGTLFKGEGFSVSETTGNGWAYGRAGGEADRCGWVLISEINSTTRTDNTCGSPKSEPLGDSEHVPGGGPSERWFVTCESATLHGNYGGGPGQLRTPAGTVGRGTALGWRYTTGDNYASSVDGPTGTPRFILRSCISRTPPAGPAPDPGPTPTPTPTPAPAVALVGPPPLRLLDEDILFERFGADLGVKSSAVARAAGPVTVKRTRATIRLAPGNIVIANGLKGDRFQSSGKHCKGWYFGTVTRRGSGAKHTGWVQKGGLRGSPRASVRTCGKSLIDFRERIGFVNAPFRSITFRKAGKWSTTGSASQAHIRLDGYDPAKGVDAATIAAGCELYLNREPGAAPTDQIQGPIEDLVFKSNDQRTAKRTIGYRYTTTDGAYALVSIKSGFGDKVGLWAFVRRDCVEALRVRPVKAGARRSTVNRVYQTEIRICNRLKPSAAVKLFNKRKRARRLSAIKPCELPDGATRKAGDPKPDSDRDGWRIGSLRR